MHIISFNTIMNTQLFVYAALNRLTYRKKYTNFFEQITSLISSLKIPRNTNTIVLILLSSLYPVIESMSGVLEGVVRLYESVFDIRTRIYNSKNRISSAYFE